MDRQILAAHVGDMKHDTLFRAAATRPSDFRFDERTAEVFDDMLLRSIPFYREQQDLVTELASRSWVRGTDVYDLGCSTGTTLVNLARALPDAPRLVGYDSSPPMLERAAAKVAQNGLADRVELRCADLDAELAGLTLENASVVTLCWTLQFIPSARRHDLVRWVHRGLVEDGVLLVTEKVAANHSAVSRFFAELHHGFKRRRGYSEREILHKREALENVLVPFSGDDNRDMLRRGGFEVVEPFFQWCNFAGFLCLKNA